MIELHRHPMPSAPSLNFQALLIAVAGFAMAILAWMSH
jgi:hypothetical protein